MKSTMSATIASVKNIILLDKPIGVTPLQLIEQFRIAHPEYAREKLGYAGRLDPMAEGLMLVLVGDENKKRKVYEALPKTYEFSVLFGIATDTYDVMGKIVSSSGELDMFEKKVQELLPQYIGKRKQSYPPYSSRTVNGKPLYYWAREGKLTDIVIPEKEIEIFDLQYMGKDEIASGVLLDTITQRLQNVQGQFRQGEILNIWKEFLSTPSTFPILHFSISCSSGTYVRSLAHVLGKELGIGAIAYTIKRTKIGDYVVG